MHFISKTTIFLSLSAVFLLSNCGGDKGGKQTQALEEYSELEVQVFESLNSIRTNPQAHVAPLQFALNCYLGQPCQNPLVTQATTDFENAITSAIRDMQATKGYPPYKRSLALDKAARDHQRDQEQTGQTGHVSSDGSNLEARVLRYGKYFGSRAGMGENIAYGYPEGIRVAYALYVDDGILDRGHRVNMLNSELEQIGIACGPHKRYRVACVIDYGFNIDPK